jgi:hypothetical protein
LYAHNAAGSPTTADRANQPEGASALGCNKKPAVRRVFVRARRGKKDNGLTLESFRNKLRPIIATILQ